MAVVRNVVRFGVIAVLVGGTAVVIAGPHRSWAFMHQARSRINSCIDSNIKDPEALRAQLSSLESQYPKRIGAVRGDLAEVTEQIAQLERELAVSKRVVALAETDLSSLQAVIAKAEATRVTGTHTVVKVRFDKETLGMDDAYAKANKIGQLRGAYGSKISDIEKNLGYLGQQRDRLGRLLEKLEKERAEFQAQLWTLNQQVNAIDRNDRLIAMLKERQATIDEQSRYQAVSLDQVTARLADIRARQEAKLEMFGQSSDMEDYENQAKFQLDSELSQSDAFAPRTQPSRLPATVIEIGPEDVEETEEDAPQIANRGG
jgi:chromosome segregation ATPase